MSTFLYLDSLSDKDSAQELAPAVKPKANTKAPTAKQSGKSLAQDTKLETILRGAVEASVRDDGWALLASSGSAAKRQAPIDPRNYGAKNFPALFAATGLFDIVKAANGQSYVADKRSKDKASVPS